MGLLYLFCGFFGFDVGSLSSLVVFLLLGNNFPSQTVNDVQEADLVLSILGQIEQEVWSQPDLGVTKMKDITHPVKIKNVLSILILNMHNNKSNGESFSAIN